MTEIQQNRWDQLIRRTANIVSPGSMVADALNELFPVLEVETNHAELLLLSGWHIAMGAINHPALAANLNHVQLFCPADSRTILVCTRVDLRASGTQEIRYAMSVAPLTDSVANNGFRDGRLAVATPPVGQVRSVQQVGGIPLVGSYLVVPNITSTIRDENGVFVLTPGTGITFATTVVNISSIFTFHWKERVAEPAELNF